MSVEPSEIKDLDIFSDLTSDEIALVAPLVSTVKVVEGETLTQVGQLAISFYVIQEGNFMIAGKDGKAITIHKPGHVIGWSAIAGSFIYTGAAIALTDGILFSMPGEEFLKLIQAHSSFGDKMLKNLNKIMEERPSFARK